MPQYSHRISRLSGSKIILSNIHIGHIWLEKNLVKIDKMITGRVIGYLTLGQPKTMRCDPKENIEKDIGAVWNKRGMNIDTITNPLVSFFVRVITHKFYYSSRPSSVPCIAMNLGYKLVKKNHEYDLAELQLQQFMENLPSVRKNKSSS